MNKRKLIYVWAFINILIIIIFIAINIPYTTVEPYTETEFYTEQEQYNTTETYFEKESYIENVPLNNYTTSGWYLNDHRVNEEFDLKTTVKNTGNVSGEFWVTFHVKSTKGSYDSTTDRVFLMPNESYQFKQTFNGSFSYATYDVYQTTKEVTKYRDVPKERTITAYRDIEKSRDVVRQREIRLSLLERILI